MTTPQINETNFGYAREMAKIITSYETISERICAIIDQFCNGNNTKFGELIGESEANVRNYKNGKTPPKYKALVAIVKNYGISPEWLLLGEGDVMRACASATQEKWRKNEDVDEEETVETLRLENMKLMKDKMALLEQIVELQRRIIGK